MLAEEIKKQMMQALKSGRSVEKEILGVALGEIQTVEAREGSVSDEQAQGIIRRLIKSNDETAAVASDEQKSVLANENAILKKLLPQTLGVDAIVTALAPVSAAVRAAGNDGQATGVAMKHLKSQGAVVDGKDVSAAVRQMRA